MQNHCEAGKRQGWVLLWRDFGMGFVTIATSVWLRLDSSLGLAALLGVSALGKFVKLLKQGGHPLFAPGKLYPRALLPPVVLLEVTTVGLLLCGELQAGLVCSSAFLAGVAHAQLQPGGPARSKGAKALGPFVVAAGLQARALLSPGMSAPPSTLLLSLPTRDMSAQMLCAASAAASFCFSCAMHDLNRADSSESAKGR